MHVLPAGSSFPEDAVGVMPLCFSLLHSRCFSVFLLSLLVVKQQNHRFWSSLPEVSALK